LQKVAMKSMAIDFLRAAEHGIALSLVDPCTGVSRYCTFLLDMCMQSGIFMGKAGVEHILDLRDLDELRRGMDVRQMFPNVGGPADAVLLRTVAGAQCFVCRFSSTKDAETFFACMSILRLSVCIAAGKQVVPPRL